MKKKSLFAVLFMAAAIASFQWGTKHENLNSLMLENVEALAEGEEDVYTECFGTGSVDCPISNVKVYLVVYYPDGYALR